VESLSLEELVRHCQRTLPDDPRAFELLVAQCKARVFTIAYRLMGDRQEAEDQAQEVLLKVYRGIKSLNDPASFVSWLDRITTNTCFDALNHQQRRPTTSSLTPQADQRIHVSGLIDTRSLSPEEFALRNELRECLERTLSRLDLLGRTALILRDIENHSYQEIAEILGIKLSAVKMRIHRTRLAFQELLDVTCPGMRNENTP
jgi:RNA polymerase sigma-70 factor, ECF subfamily